MPILFSRFSHPHAPSFADLLLLKVNGFFVTFACYCTHHHEILLVSVDKQLKLKFISLFVRCCVDIIMICASHDRQQLTWNNRQIEMERKYCRNNFQTKKTFFLIPFFYYSFARPKINCVQRFSQKHENERFDHNSTVKCPFSQSLRQLTALT